MNKCKLMMLASALLLSTSVSADYKIASGSKGRTYDQMANNLLGIVNGGTNINTHGSIENIKLLKNNEVQLAIVQLDTWAKELLTDPSLASKYSVAGDLITECVYMAGRKGGISNDTDLQDKSRTIAIGKKGSGSVSTWNYMMELEPKFKKASVVFLSGSRALSKLTTPKEMGGVDAVMWVGAKNLKDKGLMKVNNNPNMVMVPVKDWDLNNKHEALGRPVYEFDELTVKKGIVNDTEVNTICTKSVLLISEDSEEELLDNVADALLSYKSSIVPTLEKD